MPDRKRMIPLAVDNVSKNYRQGDQTVAALVGVSLQVNQGLFLAIMGASGSGKSTLLHLMAGLTRADAGTVRVNGQDLATLPDAQLTRFRRRNIGLVFQAFNLIPTLTAEENIALPLMLDGKSPGQIKPKVDEQIAALGLQSRRRHRPDALSGGEQQRVAIGRALVTDPAVILADEPTGNLDSASSQSVCELLRDLVALRHRTIVVVTHEPTVAAHAQQVVVVRDGRLIESYANQQTANRTA